MVQPCILDDSTFIPSWVPLQAGLRLAALFSADDLSSSFLFGHSLLFDCVLSERFQPFDNSPHVYRDQGCSAWVPERRGSC